MFGEMIVKAEVSEFNGDLQSIFQRGRFVFIGEATLVEDALSKH